MTIPMPFSAYAHYNSTPSQIQFVSFATLSEHLYLVINNALETLC